MKKGLTNLLALGSLTLLMFSSCKKGDSLVTTNGGKPGALSASTTTLVLDKAKLADTTKVINFNFSAPQYGYSAAVTNTLQIDSAGDNWAKPTSVTLGAKVLAQGYSTANFNSMLLKLNLPAGKASSVNIRVQHALSPTEITYSNVVSMAVTPFNLTSYLYAVGNFEGWNLANVDSLVSATGNGVYVGVLNFPAGETDFLILPQKNNYDNKYATNDSPSGTSSTVAVGANNNLYAPEAGGQFIVTLNLNNKTISFTASDHYSIIGDAAQGWGTDVEMKYLNDGSQNWVKKLPLVSTGAFKVRQDDAWSNSWGIPKAGSAGDGVANTVNNSSNNNITVATNGTYWVTFNAPASAFGSPALGTTMYSVTKQ
jgi:hypothetical protein